MPDKRNGRMLFLSEDFFDKTIGREDYEKRKARTVVLQPKKKKENKKENDNER